MLYFSLNLSGILLFIVAVAIGLSRWLPLAPLVVILLLVMPTVCFACPLWVLPAVTAQSWCLLLALIGWQWRYRPIGQATNGQLIMRRRPAWQAQGLFLVGCVVLTAVVYGVITFAVVNPRLQQLYAECPCESVVERLPFAPLPGYGAFPTLDETALEPVEEDFPTNPEQRRAHYLRKMHKQQVQIFVNSPGFGVMRQHLPPVPTVEQLRAGLRDDEPIIPQPTSSSYLPGSEDDVPLALVQPQSATLLGLHVNSVFDFVNLPGFGYVKNRREVVGFQSHRFSHVPRSTEWSIQRLELVSLLVHPEPVVYDSGHLPRMEDVRKIPTRTLTRFETAALAELRRGTNLQSADAPEGVRLLGAIRSARQCVACHGGERGDLLGAFSYVLQPLPR